MKKTLETFGFWSSTSGSSGRVPAPPTPHLPARHQEESVPLDQAVGAGVPPELGVPQRHLQQQECCDVVPQNHPGPAGGGGAHSGFAQEDAQLAAAIAASLGGDEPRAKRHEPAPAPAPPALPPYAGPLPAVEPAAGDGVLQLALRLPNGERFLRRFRGSDALSEVVAVLEARGVRVEGRHRLATGFPPRALEPASATLAELGIASQSVINVLEM